jgi:hypothetical protein
MSQVPFSPTVLIVPALLAAVAAIQIGLVNWAGLSPWKGGGFGMFSTIDSVRERTVVAQVTAGGRTFPAPLTGALAAAKDRVQSQPTRANGERLARQILHRRWQPPNATAAAAPASAGAGVSPASVRIEVRRIRFAGASDLLSTERMLAIDVAR